ncbi:uncharacterized protein PG986_012939 [Apiospora aurea]|uniref:DUF7702 domain-containing protein n=1 Tax=Apiospora aurea TaxID=335848 RepID=A0ABR1Q1E6_9PEZI
MQVEEDETRGHDHLRIPRRSLSGQRVVAKVLHRPRAAEEAVAVARVALGHVAERDQQQQQAVAAAVGLFRQGIAVLQIVCFAALLPVGVWFKAAGRLGGFGVALLSLLRLVGAGCLLAAVHAQEDAQGLFAGVLVCESFGILVLFFLLLEMMERLNHFAQVIPTFIFTLPQIITWTCIGVSIAGFVSTNQVDDALAPTPFSQSGTAITALLFVFEVSMFMYMFFLKHGDGRRGLDMVPPEEAPQFHCLVICLPLLGLRLLYAVLYAVRADDDGDDMYNAVTGSPTVYLIFTALPEIGVVAASLWAVLHIRVVGLDEMAGRGFFQTIGRLTERRARSKSPAGTPEGRRRRKSTADEDASEEDPERGRGGGDRHYDPLAVHGGASRVARSSTHGSRLAREKAGPDPQLTTPPDLH